MRRLLLIVLCFLTFSGCSVYKRIDTLERRISVLEDENLLERATAVGAVMRIRGFYGLTDADSGPGYNLADKPTVSGAASDYDLALGRDGSGYVSLYYFDSSSTEAQNLPRIVRPTDRASTDGRWILAQRTYSQEFRSEVEDGEHMFNVSNSDDPTYSGPTDWDMTVNRTKEWMGNYDTDDAEWVKFRRNKVFNAASPSPYSLPYSVHWGGTVTNFGQVITSPLTYNLKPARKGMVISFFELADGQIIVNPDDGDKFICYGLSTFSDGQSIQVISANIGKFIQFRAVENGTGNYDWAVFPDSVSYWQQGS